MRTEQAQRDGSIDYHAGLARADRLRDGLAGLQARAASADGSVVAVVNAAGALLDVEIDVGAGIDGREIARRVLDATARAGRQAQQQAAALVDATLPEPLRGLLDRQPLFHGGRR